MSSFTLERKQTLSDACRSVVGQSFLGIALRTFVSFPHKYNYPLTTQLPSFVLYFLDAWNSVT